LRNHDYIKFVLSKVENGFIEFNGSPEYARVMTILNALKSSNDILKEIYILSGINKLRELSFYLVFMFRKLESGRINLDNLLENYFADRGFIENYLKTYFNLEPVAAADEPEEEKEHCSPFTLYIPGIADGAVTSVLNRSIIPDISDGAVAAVLNRAIIPDIPDGRVASVFDRAIFPYITNSAMTAVLDRAIIPDIAGC